MKQYHQVRLIRNSSVLAHIRENPKAILFSVNNQVDSELIFSSLDSQLVHSQPVRPHEDKKRTLTCYFVLTEMCNLRCKYCDVLGPGENRPHGKTMTWEMARRGLELLTGRLDTEKDLQAQITFFGGEPLLAWPLIELICEYIASHPARDRIAKMLVTNGTLINTDRAAFLKANGIYVVVSLDGGPEVNDLMRPSSYEAVEQGLDILKKMIPEQYGISCTVGSHNAATLSKQVIFMHERFRPLSIGLNIYHYQRDGRSPIDMDPNAMAEAMLGAFRTARKHGIAIYQFIGILKAFVNRRRNFDYCPACVDKLLFTPRGRVGRCETLMDDPRFTVDLSGLKDHFLGPKLDWTRHTPEHEPDCQSCGTKWICPGSCAYDMLVKTGSPAGVDPRRCLFHSRLFAEMLELLYESCRERTQGPILIPEQCDFDAVVGSMPTAFPPNTIWIVSMSNVTLP